MGRADGCAVQLGSRHASGEHAVVFWHEHRWCVRDLGSTNGTHVDGRRVVAGERVPLEPGVTLWFGGDEERWQLADDDPPATRARCAETGELRDATDGLLALPDANDPQITLFEDLNGRWQLEADGALRAARDQDRVAIDGRAWILEVCPQPETVVPTTLKEGAPVVLGAMTLRFEVSRDGEYVALSLVRGASAIPLGGRVHHEVLLLLAEARLADKAAGQPEAERGWLYVDDLLTALKVDLQRFNVNVFRARQHVARAGVLDAGALFERRATTRQIRLGTDSIEVRRP